MGFWGWLVVVAVVCTVGVILGFVMDATSRKLLQEKLASLPDFKPDWMVIAIDGFAGLGVDQTRKKVCLITLSQQESPRIIDYRDVLEAEIIEDGHSVTKTSRTSQAASALVGGLLFGGVGAAVGALTGSTRTKEKISRVELRLVVNDEKSPVFLVSLMNVETTRGSVIHKSAMETASEAMGHLKVLMNVADAADRVNAELAGPEQRTVIIADELAKLAKLRDDGILTDEEFQGEKGRLLGRPAGTSLLQG